MIGCSVVVSFLTIKFNSEKGGKRMKKKMSEKKEEYQATVIPEDCDFDKVVKKVRAEEEKGIFIHDFKTGDIITIRTKNHTYFLKLVDPEKGRAKVMGPDPFLEKISGPISALGSTLTAGGMALKPGWIAIGHSFQLGYRVQEVEPNKLSNGLYLQPTESVSVNGVQVLPPLAKTSH